MKKAQFSFFTFLCLFFAGCASCVPGVCGCGFSIWPASWEQFVELPALLSDVIGVAGMFVSVVVMLVIWTRRRTISETARIRLAQYDEPQ